MARISVWAGDRKTGEERRSYRSHDSIKPSDHAIYMHAARGRRTPNIFVGHNRGMASPQRRTTTTPRAGDDPLAPARVRYLVNVFGGAGLAEIVQVNRSQPTRWMNGQERPGATAAPLLIDLQHVLARARLIWGEAAATTWMVSANSFLDGARPVDVIQITGSAPVLEALDAETWGRAT